MSFSEDWERIYSSDSHMSIWPWSDLVTFVMRYAKPKDSDYKVLELGCGAGANIPFFKELGVKYFSIDGSKSIIEKIKTIYPEYAETITVGDFTREIPFDTQFDLVVDRASLTHNPTEAIKRTLSCLYPKMKPEGKYIGIDWFSTEFSEFVDDGIPTEDYYTKRDFTEGHLAGTGLVHFSDKNHLSELFHQFEFSILVHKKVHMDIPDTRHQYAAWNFVAVKKATP